MSCHTWFYKPLLRSYDEAKAMAMIYLAKLSSPVFVKHRKLIAKGGFGSMALIWDYQPESVRLLKDRRYIYAELHDLWRCDYHDDIALASLQESIDFIEAHEHEIDESLHLDWLQRLTSFWENYPEGLIVFG